MLLTWVTQKGNQLWERSFKIYVNAENRLTLRLTLNIHQELMASDHSTLILNMQNAPTDYAVVTAVNGLQILSQALRIR